MNYFYIFYIKMDTFDDWEEPLLDDNDNDDYDIDYFLPVEATTIIDNKKNQDIDLVTKKLNSILSDLEPHTKNPIEKIIDIQKECIATYKIYDEVITTSVFLSNLVKRIDEQIKHCIFLLDVQFATKCEQEEKDLQQKEELSLRPQRTNIFSDDIEIQLNKRLTLEESDNDQNLTFYKPGLINNFRNSSPEQHRFQQNLVTNNNESSDDSSHEYDIDEL